MNPFRVERDSLGAVEVEADRYWGAQTQRALHNFPIGQPRWRWPRALLRALGLVKLAAAQANVELGLLDPALGAAIETAAREVADGRLDDHFPLTPFQTGSGTQSHMNACEVIANRAIELLGGVRGSKQPVHPNDHVNLGQSSNDVFPSAMHLAVLQQGHEQLLPALQALHATLAAKAQTYAGLVKTGRTHLQDAAPLTLGQEFDAWAAQLEHGIAVLRAALLGLHELAIGGTAVGTGLNADPRFGAACAARLAALSGLPLRASANPFFALAAHEPLLQVSAALRTLAAALTKLANDLRWLASGPRAGLGELRLPQNEPGSSIMPGKVNPTQCEALAMVCVQVWGHDAAVALGCSQGHFQLNAYKPVIVHNLLESIALLADAVTAFDLHAAQGVEPVTKTIQRHLDDNLMLATALNPHIGYDAAAAIARRALEQDCSLRQAAIDSGLLSAAQFDAWVDPLAMVGPQRGKI